MELKSTSKLFNYLEIQKVNSFFFNYKLLKMFPQIFNSLNISNNFLICNLKKKYMYFFFNFLKKHTNFQFIQLIDLWGIDFLNLNKRFEINYSLVSLKYNSRIFVKIPIKENISLISLTSLYSSSNWLEREVWDMFGIFFSNHNDLRRILTDYGFEGFPLRKDFPLTGFTELFFDLEQKRILYTLTELTQEFRTFNFVNPWNFNKTK